METLYLAVFFLSAGALVYVYLGYPLLVFTLSRIFPRPLVKRFGEPSVTIIITAYNEDRDIQRKLENTLLIDYPPDKLEILVASDGSTDATDNIVLEFADRGVKLFRQEGRVGKTQTQNKAVEQARGDVLLFSDATTMYQRDVLRAIVPNFGDETVGCVAGKLVYDDGNSSSVGSGVRSYWSYETFLKESESRFCSLIGASGCLYAVRKSSYVPMYREACSDFLICTNLYRQGMRSVFEPNAICTEEANQYIPEEFRMRVRVVSQTFTDLWRNREMLNPFRSGFFAVELISHKLLRYMVPLFLVTALVSSLLLVDYSVFFVLAFIGQVTFYLFAFITWFVERRVGPLGVLAAPLYFILANLSSAVGFYKFLRGERFASWEPQRPVK